MGRNAESENARKRNKTSIKKEKKDYSDLDGDAILAKAKQNIMITKSRLIYQDDDPVVKLAVGKQAETHKLSAARRHKPKV